MFEMSPATRVYVVVGFTDMRKSFNGLMAAVEHRAKLDPLSGHLFVFCNRSRNRIKILFWDSSGLWVCAKRLERGRFGWPASQKEAIELRPGDLSMLLHGLRMDEASRLEWYRR
jgi:transposase